jgi:septum formation protein
MLRVPALLLASTSPRRRQLLTAAGIAFALCEPGPEYESGGDFDHGEAGEPIRLAAARARRKALGAVIAAADALVLGVDTVVDLDGVELGKAQDRAQAEQYLRRLLGREHAVHTAHCLVRGRDGRCFERTATARVRFAAASDAALARYLDSENWRGKAGAYGIQDEAQDFIALAGGELDTVVGLSIAGVRALLAAAEVP